MSSADSRSYTDAQHAAVKRVMKCDSTDFYAILDIKKPSHEVEIKKSYRRLALSMHPDKNSAPQADEAFKRVSKAFQVLSDGNKKQIYDSTGRDPDVRGAAPTAQNAGNFGGFGGFPGAGMGGQRYAQAEMFNAEDLFNMFFNQGGNMHAQGFRFGPGGFQANFGQPRPRARRGNGRAGQQQGAGTENGSWQFLGLIFICILLFISLLSDSSSNAFSGPKFAFSPKPPFTVEHISQKYRVPFYVNPKDFAKLDTRGQAKLNRDVEREYILGLRRSCRIEHEEKQRMMNEAQGFFFIDKEKLKRAEDMDLPSCEILTGLGVYPNLL